MSEIDILRDIEKKLSAITLLLIDQRERVLEKGGSDPIRTELLLSNAGLKPQEIADLTGKSVAAIQKAIERARKSK